MEWQKTRFPGCEVKTLLFDPESGLVTVLMKFAPGAVLPDHEHVASSRPTCSMVVWSTRKAPTPGSRSAPAISSGARPAAGTWPGAPDGGLMLAIFQIPNKFYERDGRVTDISGKDWDSVWGGVGTE